jgi:indolepyruvate ferredoxin oxidoreductase
MRRLERQLVDEYRGALERLGRGLNAANHPDAVVIAELPDRVRGYEHLKVQRARDYRQTLSVRLAAFDTARPQDGRA